MATTRRNQPGAKLTNRQQAPATTLEGREHQLVNLAVDLVEKQLREGTASSQVITHYLKLGSTREQKEQKRLENENLLLQKKIEGMESAKRVEELYESALNAMRNYSGDAPTLNDLDD